MACVARVFLVRHGETAYNAVRRIQGWRDIALAARGEQQACAAAARLADEIRPRAPVAAIVSSPLQRAHATAAAIAAALARGRAPGSVPPVLTDARLKEIGLGVVEGTYLGAVPSGVDAAANEQRLALMRTVRQQWAAGDRTAAVPGGESPAAVASRACAVVAETLERLFPSEKSKMFVVACSCCCSCCCDTNGCVCE